MNLHDRIILYEGKTRQKLDGRCDYRKGMGNLPKRSLSVLYTRDNEVIRSIEARLPVRLGHCGKHQSSIKGSGFLSSPFLNFTVKEVL